MEEQIYSCPRCGVSGAKINIEKRVSVETTIDKYGNPLDEVLQDSHWDWEKDDRTCCTNNSCKFKGTIKDFTKTKNFHTR